MGYGRKLIAKTTAQSASAALALFGMAFNAEVVMHHLWDGEASIVAIVGSKTCNYCKQNQTH